MSVTISETDAKQFKMVITRQMVQWPDDLPLYSSPSGTEKAYDEMGIRLLDRMRHDDLPETFSRSSATETGLNIIPRFFFAGALKASMMGYTLAQLENGLYNRNHASLNQLLQIAHERNASAFLIERAIGLKKAAFYGVTDHIDAYDFDEENGLSIKRYDSLKQVARQKAVDDEKLEYEALDTDNPLLCEGQRHGLISVTYRAMFKICMNDPNLFKSTLEHDFTSKNR
jgi:hypothetical protein